MNAVRREMKESYSNHKTKCKILNYKTSIKKYTKKIFPHLGKAKIWSQVSISLLK